MYVATKELKVISREGVTTLFRPGDEVVGFEDWAEVPKRAHLNLGYVVVAESKQPAKKSAKKKSTTKG
jgi:hypothetical protein